MDNRLRDWLRLLQATKHLCPRCGGVLQLELIELEHEGERRAGLAVQCSECPAHLILSAAEIEAAATAQLLVRLGLRPQPSWQGGDRDEQGRPSQP